ncbi:MAG: oligosaccharide flippase family protein [Pseudomonadota bacterium]
MTRLLLLLNRFGLSAVLIGGGRLASLALFAMAARMANGDAFGLFVIALAASQLLAIFCSFGLAPAAQAVIPQSRDHKPWRAAAYVRLAMRVTGALGLLVVIVCLALSQAAVLLLGQGEVQQIFLAIALWTPVMAFSVLREFLARAFERVVFAFLPRDILWALSFAGLLLVWPAAQTAPVVVGALLLAAIEAVAYAIFWLRLVAPLDRARRIPARLYRRWTKRSSALMVNYLGGLGFERVDVIMVGFFTSLEIAGIYGVANRVATLISMTQRFIVPVISPRVARAISDGNNRSGVYHEVQMGVLAGLGLALPAVLFTMIFAEWIMALFNSGFEAGTIYLRILALAHLAIALGSNFGVVTMMGPQPWRYAQAIWSALVPTAGLLVLGVPFGGAVAAAAITALGIVSYNMILIRMALPWMAPPQSGKSGG